MPAKCSNPYCPRVFRRLREGTLLLVDPERAQASRSRGRRNDGPGPAPMPRYYWLCQECSRNMRLLWENGTLSLVFKEKARA